MKKNILIVVIGLFVISLLISYAEVDPDLGFDWIRDKSLDNFLKETTGITDDEIMFSWDISEVNTYKLIFNMEDGEQTQVTINKRNQDLDFNYQVLEWQGGGWNNDVTKAKYIDADFEEWDFNNQIYTIPQVLPNPYVSYTINKTDGKTGKIFIIKNQTIKFYWDASKNKAYLVTNGIKRGNVHTFKIFVNAEVIERKKIDVLKILDIEAIPTHWLDDGGVTDKTSIEMTDDELEQTGMHPGIKVSIGRPKIWDDITRQYVLISDLEQQKIDMTLNIKGKPILGEESNTPNIQYNMTLADIANAGLPGVYDPVSEKYILNIVKDDPLTLDPSFLQWTNLDYSMVYETVNIILKNLDDAAYEYDTDYKLSGEVSYAYTYLNYKVERKNIDDTYVVINPYKTKGIYEVYYANSEVTNPKSSSFKKWIAHANEGGNNAIYIPVNVTRTDSGTQYYTFRIDYKMSEESPSVASQLLLYDANSDTNFNPPVPDLAQVEDLVVVPPLNEGDTEPEEVSFKLSWKNTDKIVDMLDVNNKIWFELYINTMLNDYQDEESSDQNQYYQLTKVIYMRKQGTDVQISLDDVDYINADLTKENFETEIILKDDAGWISFIEPDWQGDNGDITKPVSGNVGSYVPGDPLLFKNNFFDSEVNKVPGNYFIAMRAFFDSDTTNDTNKLSVSDYSVPISFFLDIREEILKIPTNLEKQKVTDSYFELNFDATDIDDYRKFMLDPIDIIVEESQYEVLISQSMEDLKSVMNNTNVKNNKDIETAIIPKFNYIGEYLKPAPDEITDIAMTTQNITDLRDNQVLGFRIEENKLKVSNLEPNVVYYVVLRTRLNMYQGLITNKLYRFSGLSSIEAITIQKEIQLPDESEKTPPSPENFELLERAVDYIQLQWTQPIITSNVDETIGFDIIRLEKYPIKVEHKDSDTKLDSIIDDIDYDSVVSWKVRQDDIYIYDSAFDAWVVDVDNSIQNVANSSDKVFKNNNITENQIYYYYVRTVRVVSGEDKSNSSWSEISVTTDPMKAPINLGLNTNDYTFDSYYETVIEFDAPITDAASIPNQYEFGIAVKSQDEDSYIETRDAGGYNDAQLAVIDDAGDGYKKYIYKISNLLAGKKYSVKVRIYDKTGGVLADGMYPTSAYCDRIEVRTQFNQDDYDDESKYTDYVNYYKAKATDILKKSYWNLNGGDDLSVKYKEDMLNTMIEMLNNNIYDLEGKDTADEFIYYIPESSIEKINQEKVSLRKIRNNIQVIIPPNVIDKVYTTELANIIKDIDNREDEDVVDYYLKITIKYIKNTGSINSNKAISDEVTLKFEVVALAEIDEAIEQQLNTKYNDIVTEYKGTLIEDIEDEMGDDLNDVKYHEILDDILKNLSKDLADELKSIMSDADADTKVITSLYKPIMIQATNLVGGTKGYRKVSSKWEEVSLTKYLSQAYISSTGPTSYIFTSDDSLLATQIISSNPGVILNVYDRFDLAGFIEIQNIKNPSNNITGDALKNIMVKVLNVSAKDDFEKMKKEQELKNSLDLTTATPTKQQTVYNVLKLYEKITGIKTNNMYIKDYTVLEYIKNVDDKYKQSIIIANELGIIDAKTFNATEDTTYEDLFMYLNNIGS
ncbi:MAG TPA: hypothetical protein DCP90_06285 [Clostridiales bacterium]|nr:MAG: hypothetical protein A2Y22_00990 [Clostridiales bacterium GWD2_32_59]HAN10203.1 hypothetical protein [Clostridiales bacterium]